MPHTITPNPLVLGGCNGELYWASLPPLSNELKVPIWHWPPGRKWKLTSGLHQPRLLPWVFQSCLHFTGPRHLGRASWNFAMGCKTIQDSYSVWPSNFTSQDKLEENRDVYNDRCIRLFAVVICVTLVTLQLWKLPEWKTMGEWLIYSTGMWWNSTPS